MSAKVDPEALDDRAELNAAEDANAMYAAAIEDLHALGGDDWTDFNSHDPGVTFLGAMVFALADLGYIAASDMGDLLAGPRDTIDFDALGLYPPPAILPTSPISACDYRKVILDSLPNVANIWIERAAKPAPGDPLKVRFLPRAGLDEADFAPLESAIRRCLNDVRGLGDFFEDAEVVLPVPLLKVSLGLYSGSVDARTEAARVARVATAALLPAIEFQPRNLTSGFLPDDTFDGPTLAHGVLEDAQLWPLTNVEDAKARLEEALRREFGTQAFQLEVQIIETTDSGVSIRAAQAHHRAAFTLDQERSVLAVQDVDELEFPPSMQGAKSLADWLGRQVPALSVPPLHARDASAEYAPLLPKGRFLNAGEYVSFQKDLPALYGTADPVAREWSSQRVAEVMQLKAYLAVFDQLLANAHAQLADAGAALSPQAAESRYGMQPIYGVPEIGMVLRGGPSAAMRAEERRSRWLEFRDNADNPYRSGLRDLRRRLAEQDAGGRTILRHLLARFGEVLPPQFAHNFETDAQLSAWLREMVPLSRDRALAANHHGDGKRRTMSTLERRVELLLSNANGGPLVVHTKNESGEGYVRAYYLFENASLLDPGAPLAAESTDAANGLTLAREFFEGRLTHVCANWTEFPEHAAFQRYVRSMVDPALPAHLVSTWLWLDSEGATQFHALHRAWIAEKCPRLRVAPLASASELRVFRDACAYPLLEFLWTHSSQAVSA